VPFYSDPKYSISQQANDVLEVEPALEQIQATTGRLPDVMSLDNGYMSGDNLAALEKTNSMWPIASGKS
jgi:transposase